MLVIPFGIVDWKICSDWLDVLTTLEIWNSERGYSWNQVKLGVWPRCASEMLLG